MIRVPFCDPTCPIQESPGDLSVCECGGRAREIRRAHPGATPRENRPTLTPPENRPTETLEVPGSDPVEVPEQLRPAVDAWRPVALRAVEAGVDAIATEILTACRYDALLDRVARLESRVQLHGNEVERVVDEIKASVERTALEEATRLTTGVLDDLDARARWNPDNLPDSEAGPSWGPPPADYTGPADNEADR